MITFLKKMKRLKGKNLKMYENIFASGFELAVYFHFKMIKSKQKPHRAET